VNVTKLVVGRGKTSRPSEEEEWIKEYYELELSVEEPELLYAKDWAVSLIDTWFGTPTAPKPGKLLEPKPEPKVTIETVSKAFPEELRGLLYFEDTDQWILVKPRQYLGSENFPKLAAIVRDQLGGEYVSAGKESHCRVPKKQEEPMPAVLRGKPKIPHFDPEDLMKHEGWKGKKLDSGEYAKGSLAYGWDFADKFQDETIRVLTEGPQTIDKYEFSLNDSGTFVQVRKAK